MLKVNAQFIDNYVLMERTDFDKLCERAKGGGKMSIIHGAKSDTESIVYISYGLFTDVINYLDQIAEFLKIDIEHAPAPALFHIKPYLRLEQGYNTMADLTKETKLNEAVALMEQLFDETADQIHAVALAKAFEE